MAGLGANIKVIAGDLTNPESLDFVPLAVLSSIWRICGMPANPGTCGDRRFDLAVFESGRSRLIHCSTAAVAGRVAQTLVSEEMECRP